LDAVGGVPAGGVEVGAALPPQPTAAAAETVTAASASARPTQRAKIHRQSLAAESGIVSVKFCANLFFA
jgi:hypothetical protein